ncbi:MAG: ATP-dependent DNA helicase RecG [Betaproteobacteria bacterium]|nr:ATP-dependent DNA helicase RecG [Betaproteobacteria bacterium]NBY13925.1 ATP-dependent DNA helicase RecG [Betaproteobacteria bacterium]
MKSRAHSWPEGFLKLGLRRPLDLLLHFPLRYEDESRVYALSEVTPGASVQCQVRVLKSAIVYKPRRTLIVQVEDDSGQASLRFLYFRDAMRLAFSPGAQIRIVGEARRALLGLEFIHPRVRSGWLALEELKSQPLLAIYPTTQGLAQHVIRRHVQRGLSEILPKEWIPKARLVTLGLPDLDQAIRRLHEPQSLDASLEAAWNRIRLDELLAQQIALRRAKQRRQQRLAPELTDPSGLTEKLLQTLPFELTQAQKRVWTEVAQDLAKSRPSHRLIQGDVGSGKTVIAALAALAAVGSGFQAAVMAPTEILAQQLFSKLLVWLEPMGVRVVFLKGGLPAADKRARLQEIRCGQAGVVVGTHALIQRGVEFARLGLSLVDEQHRFGVAQRMALHESESGLVPHIVGMSATPIPRSLAMTFLADLDVSVIDERPPGRQPIRTRLMSLARREELAERLLGFIETEGQAYWVCPVIEEQQDAERALIALEETAAWLAPMLGERLAVVHGRLSPDQKLQAMARFVSGEARVLLATTVIEVGVDVPQARLMVIDHAERFGLAQLHQLRGRVGRGAGQSTCILLFDEPLSEPARERLRALYESDDGFELASRDLALRGPGELLGMRQSGEPSLRFSDLSRDRVWVDYAVRFGAELCEALDSEERLGALAIEAEDLRSLLERWAHRADDLLISG